jgi:hypothetical protein
MANQTIAQIYVANPITTNTNTDLMYFDQAGADAAMTYANFAAQFVQKDSHNNISANNFLSGYATTATAAATTTLTVSSKYQQYFTGTTTQTVLLPVTSTLVLGFPFLIVNNSTGIVTVESSGGNTVLALAAGQQSVFTCILTSGTTAASWAYSPVISSGGASPWTAGSGTTSAYGGGAIDGGANFTLAWGTGAEATADYGVAIGENLFSVAQYAVKFGQGGGSTGIYSFTQGNGCHGSGSYCFAMGLNTNADGDYNFAFGNGCTSAIAAGAAYSWAVGNGAISTNAGSWVIGDSNASPITDSVANQFNATFAGGFRFYAQATSGFAFGSGTVYAGADNAFAVGLNAQALSPHSFAMGVNATTGAQRSYALGGSAATNYQGSFVFADSENNHISDSATNQFVQSFTGGFYYYLGATLAAEIDTSGNFRIEIAGNGLAVAEGSNAKQGVATLSTGSVVVSNTSVTANSRIFLTAQDNNSIGVLRVSARTAGTSFTITSSIGTDSGVVAYELFEPA